MAVLWVVYLASLRAVRWAVLSVVLSVGLRAVHLGVPMVGYLEMQMVAH